MPVRRDHSLLASARLARGLTQETLARRAGTTQSTLSAYERGTKSPTLAVAERILAVLGYELALQEAVTFREVQLENGNGAAVVPDRLWRLDPAVCFDPVPVHDKHGNQRNIRVDVHRQRAEAYIWLLHHGTETELFTHLDAILLIDIWPGIRSALDPAVADAWHPLIRQATTDLYEPYLVAAILGRPLHPRRRQPFGRRARRALIERLAARGLDAEAIREQLRRRQGLT